MDTPILPVSTEDLEKIRKWRSEFLLDYAHHKKWLEKKKEWEKFYDGDQLSSEEKSTLASRGQPEVIVNLIQPRIDAVVGEFLSRRVMMRAFDKGSQDFEKAKFITEALRYVEQGSQFDDAEMDVAEDLFIGGIGWYKVSLEFDFLEPEIKISYRNNNDIILDRRCRRRDMKDAKRLWETVWVEKEDLIELYPKFKEEIENAMAVTTDSFTRNDLVGGKSWVDDDYQHSETNRADSNLDLETFIDKKRDRIRLINVWEREQKRIEFAFHSKLDEQVVEVTDFSQDEISALKTNYPGIQFFTRNKWQINSAIFINDVLLEDKKNVRPHDSEAKFPYARAVAKVDKDTKIPYGMVKIYIDPQKEYNKRRSKLLYKSMVNRIVMEKGAVDDEDIERTRKEAARPDGVIVTNPQRQFAIDKDDPNQTDVYMLQLAQSEIEGVGVAKEFIGQQDSNLSGKAIQLRQIDGNKMLRRSYAALRSARRQIFGIGLEEMQQFWTSEKLIKITDDPKAGAIILNQKLTDPVTGEQFIENNLRLGKYDIKIDEDTETPNQRQENFVALTQLAPAILQSGQPFPIEALIMASNMPGKMDLINAITVEKQRQLEIAQANAQIAQAQAVMAAGAAQQKGQNVTPTENGG